MVNIIERLNLQAPQNGFEVIDIVNGHLLASRNNCAIKYDNRFAIIGMQTGGLLWFDPKKNTIEKSNIKSVGTGIFQHSIADGL